MMEDLYLHILGLRLFADEEHGHDDSDKARDATNIRQQRKWFLLFQDL